MNQKFIRIAKYLANNGLYEEANNIIKISSKQLVISNIVPKFDEEGHLKLRVLVNYGDVKSDCEIYLNSPKLTADQWDEIAKKVNACIKDNGGEETSFSSSDIKKSINKKDEKSMYADIKKKREEWEAWYDSGGYHGRRPRF